MTGMNGTVPSSSLLARIRAGQVGGVILFGGNIDGTAALTQLVAGCRRRPPRAATRGC